MSQSEFIRIQTTVSTGALGSLTRSIVIASRESVTGFDIDTATGLYKINSSDLAAFVAANEAGSPGLSNAMRTVFAGSIKPDYVYVLSTVGVALTSAMLDKANVRPRDWSIITLASATQGIDDESAFLTDAATVGTWISATSGKLFVFTFSMETGDVNSSSMPATLKKGGAINANNKIKTLISDSKHYIIDEYTPTYDNTALAWLAFCLYGGAVVRSFGSLSDAHDFAYVSPDEYTTTERNYIAAQLLGQYNGLKDYGNTPFVWDTLLNDENDPPTSRQIESQLAIDFTDDYVKVGVRNRLQAAGQTGLPADQVGINTLYAIVDQLLKDCWNLNCILTTEKGDPDYVLTALSASQVTTLDPTWQQTGEWPSGVIQATIRPYAATHYVTLNFTYA
jgi:hypothetical protein